MELGSATLNHIGTYARFFKNVLDVKVKAYLPNDLGMINRNDPDAFKRCIKIKNFSKFM